MDWVDFLRNTLKIEETRWWEGALVTRVEVSPSDKSWDIHVSVQGPVPVQQLERVEEVLSGLDGVVREVRLVPHLARPGTGIKAVLEQRKDDISSYLFSGPGGCQLIGAVEWRVEGDFINLVAADMESWERILEQDVCSRLAAWFRAEYRLTVLVKATCSARALGPEPVADNMIITARPKVEVAALPSPVTDRHRRSKKKGSSKGKTASKQVDCHPIPVGDIEEGMQRVAVEGEVIRVERRSLKDGRRMVTYYLTDYGDTVTVKHFLNPADDEPIDTGDWIRVQGTVRFDEFEKETILILEAWEPGQKPRREDSAPKKRVELHLHTVMSALDGVVRVKDLIETVADWGHAAVAITDHGVVQAFPEAYEAARHKGVKLIYGMEGYLVDEVKQKHPYHIIILARNQEGLQNLYRLVSISHLHNFYRNPRILRQDLIKHRSGLILGTACEAGELITAYLQKRSDDELARIASFYDFLEIQPLKNNEFLVREGKVSSIEDLKEMNRSIVRLGEKLNLPVIATGDVHFLHPHHEVFRRVLQANKGYEDAEIQAPLYLRTTGEMLEEFAYLGDQKAYEVVVENSLSLAASIEDLRPVPDGNFFPTIEGAEEEISELAWKSARRIYGHPLPAIVEERLRRELDSIINNNFSVLYIIAHKLVKKSNDDGYLVGSRGSVGSSLVAFLTGITEVNPLVPHYRCPACYYTEFVRDGTVECGADLAPKACPQCGDLLVRDGFDIPFETFLGFEGDKVPDIDLNFSGEYQPNAHRYVEQLFGHEYVFRAGTINTLAEASAIGMVKSYAEKNQLFLRKGEVLRLASGIAGVKRTTGQHPGGLMVVPREKDVHEFTPLNYPANRADSGVITTHFDYHSISERLVKLDILGHDDPTMIKVLEDLTGSRAVDIPLDEKETMRLFSGVEPLGVTPEEIRSSVGTYGIPEFGTRFVRQMLEATRPRTFSELIRISGLSHGTDVWLNNAQELIKDGIATLKDVIATRDDIMTFLIHQGLEKKQAFKIMENVRKGKGLKKEEVEIMVGGSVPSWYIDSCRKIKYMFPKAHAVAYVMMAFRIAFFKVYHPREFYAGFFSVRAEDFDVDVILGGYDEVRRRIIEIERTNNSASPKDRKLLPVLEVALEMYARGFRFLPVDLYRSDSRRFLVCPEGLVLPFSALANVGDKAAESIVEARKKGEFASVEDLQRRAGISRTVVDILKKSGCLDSLPETSQLSLFA